MPFACRIVISVCFLMCWGCGGEEAAYNRVQGKSVNTLMVLLLKGQDPDLRSAAAYELSRHPPDQLEKAIPVLIQHLKDPEPKVRTYSAIALGNIGPAAGHAVRSPNLPSLC